MPTIDDVVSSCDCKLFFPTLPHAVAGPSPPSEAVHANLAIDVMFLAGRWFLHSLDSVTEYYELRLLSRRDLAEQLRTFTRIQLHRHGLPRSVLAERECNKGAFQTFCDELNIRLVSTPADLHQCNGAIERANRIIRSYFNSLRACNHHAFTVDLVQEAVYGKKINSGRKIASSIELVYRRSAVNLTIHLHPGGTSPTIPEPNTRVLQMRVRKMH